jgi:hypothetical protein
MPKLRTHAPNPSGPGAPGAIAFRPASAVSAASLVVALGCGLLGIAPGHVRAGDDGPSTGSASTTSATPDPAPAASPTPSGGGGSTASASTTLLAVDGPPVPVESPASTGPVLAQQAPVLNHASAEAPAQLPATGDGDTLAVLAVLTTALGLVTRHVTRRSATARDASPRARG